MKILKKGNPFSLIPISLALLGSIQDELAAQGVPHQFNSIVVSPEQTVTLSLAGGVSNLFVLPASISNQFMQMFDLYPLDASSDLATWTRRALLLRTNNAPGPFLYSETNGAPTQGQFYRTPTNFFITGFPVPSGAYPVGTLVRVLTDSSRSNRYGIPTNSSFMSTIWYPASPPGATNLPMPYVDTAVAADRAFYSYWGSPLAWTNVTVHCVGQSFPALPVAIGTNRFPVIIHSHGYTCDRTLNSQMAEELASHGYIVIAVDHEDCHATVYPDNRSVRYVTPGMSTNLVPDRVADIEYVVGDLSQINATDPVLAGRFDLGHIGVMGFSWGGASAAETGRLDSRVSCAALLDPAIFTNLDPVLVVQGLQKPLLLINSTIWTHTSVLGPPSDFWATSTNLYNLATNHVIWFKIANIGHFELCDFAWAQELSDSNRRGAVAADAGLIWFFDTYLKGQSSSFPTNAEIINVQRK